MFAMMLLQLVDSAAAMAAAAAFAATFPQETLRQAVESLTLTLEGLGR